MRSAHTAKTLLVVTGEPSGDRAAARVVERLNEHHTCSVFGVGGDGLARCGTELLGHIDQLTALGPRDTVSRLGNWLRVWARIRQAVDRYNPPVALLVDAPEVNLPLARVLTRAGVRVVFYIGPQVWAWRRNRLGLLGERTEMMALILPFEKQLYDTAGVQAEFVGHPVLDEPRPLDRDDVRARLGITPSESLIAFLPGSRPGEILRHATPMIAAFERLRKDGIRGVLAPAAGSAPHEILVQARQRGFESTPADLSARDILCAADAAVIASGTATLEAAVLGVPSVVVYRLDRLSWLTGKLLINIPFVALPNWVAGRQIVPELLQDDVTPESISAHVHALLIEDEKRRQKHELASVVRALGGPGAADRVAALVLERLR